MPDPEVKIEPGPDKTVEPKIEPKVEPKAEPVVEPKLEAKVEPVEPKVEPQPAPKKDWRDGRIAELTAKINELRTAAPKEPLKQAPTESDADFEARVDARAEIKASEKLAVKAWNESCEAVFKSGTTEFPDFKERLAACQSVVNAKDDAEVAQYNEVLAAAIETGKAPQLLHSLGENPGEFQRLMRLSPVKRGMELATMATKIEAAPEPSSLDKPITPIGGKGERHEEIQPDDPTRGTKLSTKEWMKRREAQALERGIQ